MKKILYFATTLFVAMGLAACDKEDAGGTATENVAGDWYVTIDAADENGEVVIEDPYHIGRTHMFSYNTAANIPTEMIIDDLSNFWEFKVLVNVNQQTNTFQTNTTENNNMVAGYEDINVTIEGGKILPKAGRQNNGSPADSIVFYVSFSDDENPADIGFKNYKVSGVRYSGLVEND